MQDCMTNEDEEIRLIEELEVATVEEETDLLEDDAIATDIATELLDFGTAELVAPLDSLL